MEQKKNFKRTTVTSALPYANGGVHIGHLAGVYVPADIYVRYLRLKKEEVVFIGGSDEHGVPVTMRARKEGITPQDVVDRYHKMIKDSFEQFGISFDVYSRTTSKTHHEFASEFFRKLYDEGKLVEETTKQYYDEETHQFLADRYITGECPHCHNAGAYGDQCEKCGRDLSPTELINPKSTISGSEPVLKDTKNWYLPLDKYQDWLKEWILEGHKEWRPNVYGQCKSWLDMDLQPRAMTRDLDWGIPVPVEGAEGKVLYVWFDAPIGYVSNTKELCDSDPERWGTWQKWWQDEETRLVHFIGKDNIVFHCIIFPTMMKAHGDYIMPDNVPANEFLNLENDKISTSRNWAVWLHEYLVEMPGKQDVLRYVLTANAPETKDNNFMWKDFQERNNSELVAIYGNFVNRALQLTKKYFDGVVPERGEMLDIDRATLEELGTVKSKIESLLDQFKFREAQFEAMNLARLGNRYITECEPWKVWKTDPKRVETVLNICLQLTANLAIAFEPFLPFSSKKLQGMLNINMADSSSASHTPAEGAEISWDCLGNADILKPGHRLAEPELLFEKIEDETIDNQIKKLEDTKKANEAAEYKAEPVKTDVDFDTFEKMDIRVGKVLRCEKVKKSKKLLQFAIDDGSGTERTILSGIAAYYEPEQLVGKQVLFVANFAPRKMMGIESQGMILSAVDYDGSLHVTTVADDVKAGSRVG
ncbi:MAG: methionine--tRNA ligase [Prevotella sp.]|uniref:methionine--tRNA ligase n=1 Tax=Prevotella sp. TaxID=59823 RepID=UPI002A2979DA|nr:methionine--tRNA ligase [Prevotella sp.]MDD7318591.1 methionine--tRNA ligase [Prevotellaceae bacterium]MDY4020392.1 methionine--tRNA ligase [Prevotella sp.]